MAKINVIIAAKSMLARGLAGAKAGLDSFAKSAAQVGKRIAVGFLAAGAALAGFAAKGLKAYAVQEQSVKSLTASIEAYGESSAAAIPKLKDVASAIQVVTGVADEQTLANMSLMRSLGVETAQLEAAAKGAIALERANMGSDQAARAMAAAMQGNFEMLTRYIPALKGVTDETEKATLVNDFLTRGYAATKAELDTVGGQWDALKGNIGDAWEAAGEWISQNANLVEMLKTAQNAVKEFVDSGKIAEWATKAQETLTSLAVAVVDDFKRVRSIFQKIVDAKVDIAVGLITLAVGALTIKLVLLSKKWSILAMNMTALKAATIAQGFKIIGLKADGATRSIIATKVAMIALKAVGVGAIAVMFVAIAKAALDAAVASHKLNKSIKNLKGTEDNSIKEFGARSATLRKIRLAIKNEDSEELEKLRKIYPEAVANAEKLLTVKKKIADVDVAKDKPTSSILDLDKLAAESAAKKAAAQAKSEQDAVTAAEEAAAAKLAAAEKADAAITASMLEASAKIAAAEKKLKDLKITQQSEKVAAIQKEIDKKKALAKMTVHGFLANAQAAKADEERIAKNEEKAKELQASKDRGAKLSTRQEAWLAAQQKIAAARNALNQPGPNNLPAQLTAAQDALKALQEASNKTQRDLVVEIQTQNKKMDKLLAMR